MQRVPKAGHWCGLSRPRSTSPARHSAGSLTCSRRARSETRHRSRRTPRGGPVRSAGSRRCPRHWRLTSRNTRLTRSRAGTVPSRVTARTYWFSTSCRPSSSCRTARSDPLEDVERLEAGHDDRHPVRRRDGLVLGPSHHGADVAGGQEGLHPVVGRARGWRSSPAARSRARPGR